MKLVTASMMLVLSLAASNSFGASRSDCNDRAAGKVVDPNSTKSRWTAALPFVAKQIAGKQNEGTDRTAPAKKLK